MSSRTELPWELYTVDVIKALDTKFPEETTGFVHVRDLAEELMDHPIQYLHFAGRHERLVKLRCNHILTYCLNWKLHSHTKKGSVFVRGTTGGTYTYEPGVSSADQALDIE